MSSSKAVSSLNCRLNIITLASDYSDLNPASDPTDASEASL